MKFGKKTLLGVFLAGAIGLGSGFGTYAYFTASTTSDNANTIQAGTLGVNAEDYGGAPQEWESEQLNINNLQPGSGTFTYYFDIDNTTKNGEPSTLDLKYKINVLNQVAEGDKDLLKVAKYRVRTWSGEYDYSTFKSIDKKETQERAKKELEKANSIELNYDQFTEVMSKVTEMEGSPDKKKIRVNYYDIIVRLPEHLTGKDTLDEAGKDNDYQGAKGSFKLQVVATQKNNTEKDWEKGIE